MILFLILAIIVGSSVILIGEGLRKAPEAIEDEYGFHVIGESATKKHIDDEHSDQRADAPIHASFLGAVHSK